MQRASLDFWENYLETMLFLSILLNSVWSASSAKSRKDNNWEKNIFKCSLKKGIDPFNLLDSKKSPPGW